MAKSGKLITLLIDLLFLAIALLPGLLFLRQTFDLIGHRSAVWLQHNHIFEHLDFVSFYACGKMILQGQSQNVYDTSAQLAAYNQVIQPAHVPYTNFLQHVPYVFCFLPLLALLSLRDAYLVWTGLSTLFALVGGVFMRLAYLSRHFKMAFIDTAILTLLMFTSLPGNFCLLDGQLSWLYFAVLAFFAWSLLNRRDIGCGMTLAFLSIKPQYFLFLLVPLLVQKNKKALLTAAISIMALTALAGFTLGWQNVLHYPQILLSGESAEHFAMERPKTMISVRGILSILFTNKAALLACFALEMMALAGAATAWYKCDKNDKEQNRWCLIFTFLLMLVVSAHCYLYEGVLLAAPALLMLPSWRISLCLAESGAKKYLALLFLCLPPAYLIILLCAPKAAALVLSPALMAATADNGIKGNLLMYFCLFFYNVMALTAALCAMTRQLKIKSTNLEPSKKLWI